MPERQTRKINEEENKNIKHYPFRNRAHIVLASQLYDPPWDFALQMTDPDCFAAHLDINKIPLYVYVDIHIPIVKPSISTNDISVRVTKRRVEKERA